MSNEQGAADSTAEQHASWPIEVVWGGPSIFVNKAVIVNNPFWLRITFAEQGNEDDPINFRAAVTMTPLDAIAFCDTLLDVLRPYREWAEKVKVAQAGAGEGHEGNSDAAKS